MGADTFDQLFSGVQVVGVNRKEIQVTVQPALLELAIKQGGVDLAENRLTEYALDACKAGLGDFLKGRRLKIVP
jgi:hypothetical protein